VIRVAPMIRVAVPCSLSFLIFLSEGSRGLKKGGSVDMWAWWYLWDYWQGRQKGLLKEAETERMTRRQREEFYEKKEIIKEV